MTLLSIITFITLGICVIWLFRLHKRLKELDLGIDIEMGLLWELLLEKRLITESETQRARQRFATQFKSALLTPEQKISQIQAMGNLLNSLGDKGKDLPS